MKEISRSYVTKESFETYRMYQAMHRHFNVDKFDFHKYNGKTNVKVETFRTRNDVYSFYRLSQEDNVEELILANLLHDKKTWVRDIVSDEGKQRYAEWRRKKESLTRVVKDDLNQLNDDWQSNFVSINGQHPVIISLYLQKQITLETFTILTHIANIFAYWETNLLDKIVAYDIIKQSRKYRPFLKIDEKKFKKVIREHFF